MNYNYQIVFWGKFSALKKRKLVTIKFTSMGSCGENVLLKTSEQFQMISQDCDDFIKSLEFYHQLHKTRRLFPKREMINLQSQKPP